MTAPSHLVVVCGHAIWVGGPKKGLEESEWLIESYKSGETPTFIKHIKAGIDILGEDERSVVMFSGGPTRKETPLSEGRSYANLAAANDYFGVVPAAPWSADCSPGHPLSPTPHHPRVMVEERALDSYHNILFSILQFWRNHDCAVWPQHLTIVSHGFKRARLVESHCSAIAYPLDRVAFVGINPPDLPAELAAADRAGADGAALALLDGGSGLSEEKAEAMKGAREVVGHWREDPHGVGEVLAGKRKGRNFWGVQQLFFTSQEERQRSGVKTLLRGDVEVLNGDGQPWALRG